jgi:hypothetical protein
MYTCTYCTQNIFKTESTCVYALLNSSSSCHAKHVQLVDTKTQSNAVLCMTGYLDSVMGKVLLAPAIYFPHEIQRDTKIVVFRDFTLPLQQVVPRPSQKPENTSASRPIEHSDETHDLNDALLKSTKLFKSKHKQYDTHVSQSLELAIEESRMVHNINTTRAEMKLSPIHWLDSV